MDQALKPGSALEVPADLPAPGFGELPPSQLDLDPFLDRLNCRAEDLDDEFDRAFGLVYSSTCPPFETEYYANSDPFFRAQQMADVAGFYRAFGLTAAATGRPDHLALELEFVAFLLLKRRQAVGEEAAVCDAALRAFFRDHVAWWVPSFAAGLRRRAGAGLYAELATVLAAWLPLEGTAKRPFSPLQSLLGLIDSWERKR